MEAKVENPMTLKTEIKYYFSNVSQLKIFLNKQLLTVDSSMNNAIHAKNN